jgi:lipoate-protein ligase A
MRGGSRAGWRILRDGAAHGAWNMGVDEALLATAARTGAPTFRLYGWQGSWLSLGYAQDLPRQQGQACSRSGVGLVRRATGGRAVLHGCDLTYCVTAPLELIPSGLDGSYEALSGALLDALRAVGVGADCSASDAPASRHALFDCFQHPAAHEICVSGRKLVGSAQRRWNGAFLQHGSIRLSADPTAAATAAGLAGSAATSLEEEGHHIDVTSLRDACIESFGARLGGRWELGTLSEIERVHAHKRRVAHQQNSLQLSGLTHRNGSRAPLSDR